MVEDSESQMTPQNLSKILSVSEITDLAETGELLELLQEWGVLSKSKICEGCGAAMALAKYSSSSDKKMWRCRNKVYVNHKHKLCDKKLSVRVNTIFGDCQISVGQIVLFYRLWIDNSAEVLTNIDTAIGTFSTRAKLSNYGYEVCKFYCDNMMKPIGGPEKIVEIDESISGYRKYKRGHKIDGQMIFGGIERNTNFCFFVPVKNRTPETLLPIIQKHVLPGSTVVSDESGACSYTVNKFRSYLQSRLHHYRKTKDYFEGYLAHFMFLERCNAENIDVLREFLVAATKLYDEHSHTINSMISSSPRSSTRRSERIGSSVDNEVEMKNELETEDKIDSENELVTDDEMGSDDEVVEVEQSKEVNFILALSQSEEQKSDCNPQTLEVNPESC